MAGRLQQHSRSTSWSRAWASVVPDEASSVTDKPMQCILMDRSTPRSSGWWWAVYVSCIVLLKLWTGSLPALFSFVNSFCTLRSTLTFSNCNNHQATLKYQIPSTCLTTAPEKLSTPQQHLHNRPTTSLPNNSHNGLLSSPQRRRWEQQWCLGADGDCHESAVDGS